jgi:hypothetical protein
MVIPPGNQAMQKSFAGATLPPVSVKPVVPLLPPMSAPQPKPEQPAPAAAPSSQPLPVKTPDEIFDESLPQPVSLAADDVAKEREKQQAAAPATSPSPAPETKPEPPKPEPAPAATIAKHAAPMLGEKAAKPVPEVKRKLIRHEKPAEHVASKEEAAHNEPSEAAKEVAPLTGMLIMPSADKPKPETDKPKAEKPKKLAPGEVYVDEHGNVMIGE